MDGKMSCGSARSENFIATGDTTTYNHSRPMAARNRWMETGWMGAPRSENSFQTGGANPTVTRNFSVPRTDRTIASSARSTASERVPGKAYRVAQPGPHRHQATATHNVPARRMDAEGGTSLGTPLVNQTCKLRAARARASLRQILSVAATIAATAALRVGAARWNGPSTPLVNQTQGTAG